MTFGDPRNREPRRQASTLGPPPRPSLAPLFLALVALAMTGWLVLDRLGVFRPAPMGEPRLVVPRGELASFEETTIAVFEANASSVVHITREALMRDFWGRVRRYQDGSGSGFVWDASGTIVTNEHVVEGVRSVKVAIGEEVLDADVIQRSRQHDIAVLRLRQVPRELRPIPVGSSADLKVGQYAIAIGNPFGLDQTLTTGVISALDRTIQTRNQNTLRGVIQIDAAINPGNSGGPLLDSAGRLIGMNTAIYSPTGASAGIGFAVPADTINSVVPALIAGRDPGDGLGVVGERVALPMSTGYKSGLAVIEQIGGGGSELLAFGDEGTRGDVIVGVDGKRVDSMTSVRAALRGRVLGDRVPVRVIRIESARPLRFDELELTLELR
ncbi:MAG: trypsin-like serine protease [bacterium]|nr:trypsin-like serine protease [bacterium]